MTAQPVTLTVFFLLFALVAGIGLFGARWRAADLSQLTEWGLGGRRFGTIITWFLMGGDLYTAYTFIAVPAVMFGAGAAGFFAIPYATLMYPIMFLVFPRLWSVAHAHGYVTAADFVRGRFDNRPLALVVALTSLVATMPYIALQLMGIEVVIAALGLNAVITLPLLGSVSVPLLAAFAVLAAYTYNSGLRGTALVAVVKDILIYATVLAAIIIIPAELGGYASIFASIDPKMLTLQGATGNLGPSATYISLFLGSTLALFMYPHAITGLLSASSRQVVKRNSMILPAYSLALAFIALLGYMAIAAGLRALKPDYVLGFTSFGNNFAVPALFLAMFPPWFVGVAFAAIAVGALVPASMMAISCGNLFSRNIYKDFIAPDCSPPMEARMAKLMSLAVKLGALLFVLEVKTAYAIQFQLLGGIWICQVVPSVLLALYVRLNPWGLLAGWAAGIASGTAMAWALGFKGSVYPLHLFGWTVPCYAALSALLLNVIVALAVSLIANAFGPMPADQTMAEDYV